VGGVELVPANAGDVAFAQAPVHLVARGLLERFGPFGGSCVELPAWQRLAQRLEQRGHVNGFVWPVLYVDPIHGEGAA
jgi:hypothetical protein